MKNIMFTGLLLSVVVFFSCKEKGTNPPENPLPEGYQQDVLWPSLADSPWPMYHHDPQNTGRYKGTLNLTGEIEWETQVTELKTGLTLGADSTIYYCNRYWAASEMVALKPNGEVKWRFPLGSSSYTPPTIAADGTLYALCDDLVAVNPDGTLKWRAPFKGNGQSSVYIGIDGTLYVIGNNSLYAIAKNGNLKWELAKPSNTLWGNLLVFSPDGKTGYVSGTGLTAFDLQNATIKWIFNESNSILLELVDSNGNIYFHSTNKLYSMKPDGILRWSLDVHGIFNNMTIDKNGNIFFGIDTLYCVSYQGKIKYKKPMIIFNSALISDDAGNVYVFELRGAANVLVIITSDGNIKKEFVTDPIQPSVWCPALGFGRIYFLGDNIFTPEQYIVTLK